MSWMRDDVNGLLFIKCYVCVCDQFRLYEKYFNY